MLGTGLEDPVLGTGLEDPVLGTGLEDPVLGTEIDRNLRSTAYSRRGGNHNQLAGMPLDGSLTRFRMATLAPAWKNRC